MAKFIGLLPYIYFFDEPFSIGRITFFSVPDIKGRDMYPKRMIDRKRLHELINCFPVSRGLKSDKGVVRSFTYFLIDNPRKNHTQIHADAKKAVTILRYLMLRPDNQGIDDLETSAVYLFEIPPTGSKDTRIYHGWINFNQEEWLRPKYQKFHPPGWNVDCIIKHTSDLEDLDVINHQLYNKLLDSDTESNIILAMDWYNLSFQRYSIRDIAGHLVDIATAFETLFQLPRHYKTAKFRKHIRETFDVEEGSVLDDWARHFYVDVRSETIHAGKPMYYLYKHPDASSGHLSFLWSAQKIFRACIAVKLGLKRNIENDFLLEELIPNEVVLKRLRDMGSYANIKDKGLTDIWKLRQRYPVGDKENIIWLGNTLLTEFLGHIPQDNLTALVSSIQSILHSGVDDDMLWSKYVNLDRELSDILFKDNTEKAKQLSSCIHLAYDVSKFSNFAWYALQILTFTKNAN
ncbi:MAG: hypothetical protein JW762_08165 [Dehalococcoidales bacterium]|nr:hypothetical protein [Dehalococcoidales bacterium]